jgi:hypothetical protein
LPVKQALRIRIDRSPEHGVATLASNCAAQGLLDARIQLGRAAPRGEHAQRRREAAGMLTRPRPAETPGGALHVRDQLIEHGIADDWNGPLLRQCHAHTTADEQRNPGCDGAQEHTTTNFNVHTTP